MRTNNIQAAILLILGGLVLFVGQAGRELFPPDDLREVELAREMLEDGDYIVPHLAGLPFVEKPPGFQAVVAVAYRIFGGPSALVARLVSAAFALASLAAVFLLGRRTLSIRGGGLAATLLALSSRFCRTAHEVLLDNALTTLSAFTLLFTWIALEAAEPWEKRRAYTAAAFSIGLAFLVKGFVWPALFGAGFLTYVAVSRRKDELRHALRPLPVAAFFVPVLAWVGPFVANAAPDLIHEFFVANHIGRFMSGYHSNVRPFYFYLLDVWPDFAPSSFLLPFAAVAAWQRRRQLTDQAGIFFLSLVVGLMVLLSISQAKDAVYLLPAYPALAMLVAWWCVPILSAGGRWAGIGVALVALLSVIGAEGAVAATELLGGTLLSIVAAAAVACGTGAVVLALRRQDLWAVGIGSAALVALSWILFFTGPIAAIEAGKRAARPYLEEVFKAADDHDILLYRPNDMLRGGTGFYRNRTALEVRSPSELVERLSWDSHAVALLRVRGAEGIPRELQEEANASGVELREQTHVPLPKEHFFLLIRAVPRSSVS